MPKKTIRQPKPSMPTPILLRFILVLTVAVSLLPSVFMQSGNRWATVINQLLDYPAPPPPMLKEVENALAAQNKEAMKTITAPNQEPGADATPGEVIRYCRHQLQQERGTELSEKIRRQLLEACLQDEYISSDVLDLLPDTPTTHSRVKQYLDEPEPSTFEPPESFEAARVKQLKNKRENLRGWLRRHGNYFRGDLLEAARAVKANGHQLKNQDDLEALARLDWQTARPIIEDYLNQPDTFVQSFALKLLYLHAVEVRDAARTDALRRRLLEMTTNPQVSEYARRMVYDALTQHEWLGQQEWFSSLLALPGLLTGKSALLNKDTVSTPIRNAPERWNSLLAQSVTSGNPAVRNNAISILVLVALRKPNREALLPLLPWLSDPKWAEAEGNSDRHFLIEAAGKLLLPEAVPGLLAIVQNEKEFVRTKAVEALAQYRDAQTIAMAAPVLRAAMNQEPLDYSVSAIAGLLAANRGLDDSEILSALEAAATETKTIMETGFVLFTSGKDWMPYFLLDKNLSRKALIGSALIQQHKYGRINSTPVSKSPFTESVATGLMSRIKVLEQEKPEVAATLWMVARALDFPSVDAAIAERVLEGKADAETVLIALKTRQRLASRAGITLQPMLGQGGYASGVTAVLLSDTDKARSILESKDRDAQITLLACARLVRMALPIELVGKLLAEKYKPSVSAAERYLESEDSPAARQLILAQHPNEAMIFGGAPDFDPKRKYREDWIQWEDALREDLKRGRAEEVFGEYEVYYSDTGGPDRQSLEIHVLKDQATICRRKDAARKECRALLPEELSNLRSLFEEVSFDELPPLPLPGSGFGGTAMEFVRLNKNAGRRVYGANIRLHSGSGFPITPHHKLSDFFRKLKTTGNYELRYALKEKIKDLEVILADDKRPVSNVCGQGREIRALVKDEGAKYSDLPKWRAVTAGKIVEETEQPAACPIVDTREDLPESMRRGFEYQPPLWPTTTKDGIVRDMTWNEQWGLWLCRAGNDPKLITQEKGDPLLVTPDGRWLMISKSSRERNELMRIDMKTGQAVKIEAPGWDYPIVPEPLSGRIVIPTFRREKDSDPRIYEVKLYTPSTGKLESAKGEFEPLKHQRDRGLQPIAGSANEFWAAIPDEKEKKTSVGRYDARAFKFTSQLELPEIVFNSTQMWVDETAQQLYVTYNGHLLRLPFAQKDQYRERRLRSRY